MVNVMMKKTILKLALSVVTAVMICPVASQASAEPSLASDGEKIIDEKTTRRIKESKSSLQYEELMDSFEETETGELIYPNYYGGSYIDDDGGFVVCVVAANTEEKEYASKSIEETINASDFKIKNVKYSYNELEEMMEFLNKYKQNTRDSEIAKNWSGHFLSDSDNAIFVELDDVSDEQISLFRKEVTASPMISFINSGGQVVDCANLNPEKGINNPTMGISGRWDIELVLTGELALLRLLMLFL